MLPGVKYNIDTIDANGKPLQPRENALKFIHQCGVLVRDLLPISAQLWKKPAKVEKGVTWVDERAKENLWGELISHFTLPDHFTEQQREKVKKHALQKMATSFRNHKKNIWADYVDNDKKTPEFKGTLEKQRPHWDDFVTCKE